MTAQLLSAFPVWTGGEEEHKQMFLIAVGLFGALALLTVLGILGGVASFLAIPLTFKALAPQDGQWKLWRCFCWPFVWTLYSAALASIPIIALILIIALVVLTVYAMISSLFWYEFVLLLIIAVTALITFAMISLSWIFARLA